MGSQAKNTRESSLKAAQQASEKYWERVTEANTNLRNSMNTIFEEYGKSVTDYKDSVKNMLADYNENVKSAQTDAQGKLDNSMAELNKDLNKYTGENAYKDTLKMGQRGAASSAGRAASEATGAARAAGLTPAQAAMLGANSTINAYNQGLDTQQTQAANQYAAAANAAQNKAQLNASNIKDMLANSMTGYGNALNGQMQGAAGVLSAAGNKMQNNLQGESAIAANQVGGAAQAAANYTNLAQTSQASQNFLEKFWNDLAHFADRA